METGFNAMGKPVPTNRLQKGYLCGYDNETAMDIARRVSRFIEADKTAYIIGDVCLADELSRELLLASDVEPKVQVKVRVDEMIASIDLTGRYRLLAEMLTD